jgi:hypothetical protein
MLFIVHSTILLNVHILRDLNSLLYDVQNTLVDNIRSRTRISAYVAD